MIVEGLRNKVLALAVPVMLALAFVAPMSAHATPIVAGESIGISINENAGGENIVLTGSIGFTSVSTTQMVFDIDLTNASSHGARMVSIGFDIAVVDSLTATSTGGGLAGWKVELDPKQPMNGIRVNLCIFAGKNCAGGSNAGLTPGSLAGTLTLDGVFSDPIFFLDFFARFQDVGEDNEGSETYRSTVPVPEPGVLGLLGLGLLGLVMMRRRFRLG